MILLQPKAEDGQQLGAPFLPVVVERLQQTVVFVDVGEPQRQLPALPEGRAALYLPLGKIGGGSLCLEAVHGVIVGRAPALDDDSGHCDEAYYQQGEGEEPPVDWSALGEVL